MQIVGFGQTMRLNPTPKMGHELRVIGPDGREVSIPTCEETVSALLKLWNGSPLREAPPVSTMPDVPRRYPENYVESSPVQDEHTHEFGGDLADPPAPEETEQDIPEAPAVIDTQTAEEPPRPPVRARAAHVDRDEMGYPRLPQPSFLQEEDGDSDEEDGQQI